MPTYRPPEARCTIRVFKAGLLSAVGHDLELRVARFSILVEGGHISAEFDGSSLQVEGAVEDGRVNPGRLSEKDKRDILDNVRKSVFKGREVRSITFSCEALEQDDEELEGEGSLLIPPHAHPLPFKARVEGGRAVCELRLHQPDWGIVPYKAPLGVLRIQPDLAVRIELPWKG